MLAPGLYLTDQTRRQVRATWFTCHIASALLSLGNNMDGSGKGPHEGRPSENLFPYQSLPFNSLHFLVLDTVQIAIISIPKCAR